MSNKKINKKYLLLYISNFIVSELEKTKLLNYNIVKSYIYNDDSLRPLLNKKKNESIYLDILLRYDKTLKLLLLKNSIAINRDGEFTYANPLLNTCKIDDPLIHINEYELDNQFCPYMDLVLKNKQTRRVSFKQTRTNERVLNYTLNSNELVFNLVQYIQNSIKTLKVENKSNINSHYYILTTEYDKLSIIINDNSVDIKLSPSIKKQLTLVKKIYPFKFFAYFYISTVSYLLNEAGYHSESKYISIKLFDITMNGIIKKYFSDIIDNRNLLITNLYDIFYKDKIQSNVYDDYLFINEFHKIFNDSDTKNFISYMIGHYKLYIYLKNKYNRDIKNIALELYENKNRNLINKIIGFNDATNYCSDIMNSDVISTEDLLT